jgi:prepilin-type N-terminal cleavage/methylation domain-containing protein
MTRRKQLGVTLIEVMIVTGIIAVLLILTTILVSPLLRRGVSESRVRADLHQIAFAIQTYIPDYDGVMPPNLKALGGNVPREYKPWDSNRMQDGFEGRATYFYNANAKAVRAASVPAYHARVQFDPDKYSVVDAVFLRKQWDIPTRYWFRLDDGSYRTRRGKSSIVLGAWLDGHVAWKSYLDDWQQELATLPAPR